MKCSLLNANVNHISWLIMIILLIFDHNASCIFLAHLLDIWCYCLSMLVVGIVVYFLALFSTYCSYTYLITSIMLIISPRCTYMFTYTYALLAISYLFRHDKFTYVVTWINYIINAIICTNGLSWLISYQLTRVLTSFYGDTGVLTSRGAMELDVRQRTEPTLLQCQRSWQMFL